MNEGRTLICTTFNEGDNISTLLSGLEEQSRVPDELIFVDAGSTDGTLERLRTYDGILPIQVHVENGCNIAEGRNAAIKRSTNKVIASIDAGTQPCPSWFECITDPLVKDTAVDVVSGYYEPNITTTFQKCSARFVYIPRQNIDGDDFLPSSRSIAFRKEAWAEVGGYPEHLVMAEDTLFDLRLKAEKKTFQFEPRAVVRWDHDSNLRDFVRRRYAYSYWAGIAGIIRGRSTVFVRVGAAFVLITVAVVTSTYFLLLGLFIAVALVGHLDLQRINQYDTTPRSIFPIELILMCTLRVINDFLCVLGFTVGSGQRMLGLEG